MQHSMKVVVLGKSSVGKTSLVSRAVTGRIKLDQAPTLGAAFATKVVELDSARVTLQIWDTAGQERFHSLAPMYYHGAHVALIVFDVADLDSVAAVRQWAAELAQHGGTAPVAYVVGNKADLADARKVEPEAGQRLADELSAFYFETSAVRGTNVEDLFLHIAGQAGGQRGRPAPVEELAPVVRKRRGHRGWC
jgi:Ras-related protein Rab-5C